MLAKTRSLIVSEQPLESIYSEEFPQFTFN